MKQFVVSIAVVMLIVASAEARGRQPCSGKMGGVSHCSGGKFVCKNGQISRSTRACSREG